MIITAIVVVVDVSIVITIDDNNNEVVNDGDDALILSPVALEDLHLTEMTLAEASGLQRLLLSQVCVDTFSSIFCYILMRTMIPSLVVCYILRHVLLHSEVCYPTF